jgi:tRNA-specific 2-thiouridylase
VLFRSFDALVQVRHRQEPLAARIDVEEGGRLRVAVTEATVAAPGQAAVLYQGDRVLGGGWVG